MGTPALVPDARPRAPGGSTAVNDDRLRAFVDGEYRQVVATVELVCGSLATAEDAVQEALARAWEREARGETIDRLPAWITTVALNLARSQMRRWRGRPERAGATGSAVELRARRPRCERGSPRSA